MNFSRATFRVRGDVLEIFPAYEEDLALRVEIFDDEIERISEIDPLTGKVKRSTHDDDLSQFSPRHSRRGAFTCHRNDQGGTAGAHGIFMKRKKNLSNIERIQQRTMYDLEMIREMGFCKGIENYSRHFSNASQAILLLA